MKRTNFSKGLAKAVAILCILALLPVTYASAVGLSITATAGGVSLSDSDTNAVVIDKNARFTVNGTSSEQGQWITIVVLEKNSQGTGNIQYINQVTSGVNGTFAFLFSLPLDIGAGTYEIRVAKSDTSSDVEMVKKYFKIEETAPTPTPTSTAAPTTAPTVGPTANPTTAPTTVPTANPTAAPTVEPTATPSGNFISLPEKLEPVGIGQDIEFDVQSNVSPLIAQLIEQENIVGDDTVRPGTVTENEDGSYRVTIGTEGLEDGIYTIEVFHEDSGTTATVDIEVGEVKRYIVTMKTSGNSRGTARVTNAEGESVTSAEFLPGETVYISASGATFSSWSAFPSGIVLFLDNNDASTQFDMPEEDVVITANFQTSGGTNTGGGNSGGPGNGVTIRPTATPSATSTPAATAAPSAVPTAEPGNYPADIAGIWSEPYIKDVIDKGIMQGNTDGTFGPENVLTRGEFATSMVRILGLEPASGVTFPDTEGHWAQDYVSVLVENGIIQGYDDGTFGVDDPITREQIALILCRAYGLKADASEFVEFPDDAQISEWAREAVYTVQAYGYMTGDDAGFRPQDTATRGEIASVLSRISESQS